MNGVRGEHQTLADQDAGADDIPQTLIDRRRIVSDRERNRWLARALNRGASDLPGGRIGPVGFLEGGDEDGVRRVIRCESTMATMLARIEASAQVDLASGSSLRRMPSAASRQIARRDSEFARASGSQGSSGS
jgi:hypothetical protein